MVRTEPIIGVSDVKKSSQWYQQLLGCRAAHGGDVFEILTDSDGTVLMCLHKWGEHEHPTLTSPEVKPGNGLILYFVVDDITKAFHQAREIDGHIVNGLKVNPNTGRTEFSLIDPDGYYISICSNESIVS